MAVPAFVPTNRLLRVTKLENGSPLQTIHGRSFFTDVLLNSSAPEGLLWILNGSMPMLYIALRKI